MSYVGFSHLQVGLNPTDHIGVGHLGGFFFPSLEKSNMENWKIPDCEMIVLHVSYIKWI